MDKGIVSGQVNFRSGRGGITENSWWVPFVILLEESYMDTRVEVSEQPGRPGEYRSVMARHGDRLPLARPRRGRNLGGSDHEKSTCRT